MSDRYRLVGRYNKMDVCMQVAQVVKDQPNITQGYIGLTSQKVFWRFHETPDDGQHFPHRGRAIYLLARASANLLRKWEGYIIGLVKQQQIVALANSDNRGGSGITPGKHTVSLDFLVDDWQGECCCRFCRTNQKSFEEVDGPQDGRYWFPGPVEVKEEAKDAAKEEIQEEAKEEEANKKKRRRLEPTKTTEIDADCSS